MSEPVYVEAGPWPEPAFFAVPAVPIAMVEVRKVPMAEIGGVFDASFGLLAQAIQDGQFVPGEAAVAVYTRFGEDAEPEADAELGFWTREPLTDDVAVQGVLITGSELPAGEVAALTHVGSYDKLHVAWEALTQAILDAGREPAMPCWEVYRTEPTPDADPATMRTDLFCKLA